MATRPGFERSRLSEAKEGATSPDREAKTKTAPLRGAVSYWLPGQDLNLDKQHQKLLCYQLHYRVPQWSAESTQKPPRGTSVHPRPRRTLRQPPSQATRTHRANRHPGPRTHRANHQPSPPIARTRGGKTAADGEEDLSRGRSGSTAPVATTSPCPEPLTNKAPPSAGLRFVMVSGQGLEP